MLPLKGKGTAVSSLGFLSWRLGWSVKNLGPNRHNYRFLELEQLIRAASHHFYKHDNWVSKRLSIPRGDGRQWGDMDDFLQPVFFLKNDSDDPFPTKYSVFTGEVKAPYKLTFEYPVLLPFSLGEGGEQEGWGTESSATLPSRRVVQQKAPGWGGWALSEVMNTGLVGPAQHGCPEASSEKEGNLWASRSPQGQVWNRECPSVCVCVSHCY